MIREVLTESKKTFKRSYGLDLTKPLDYLRMLTDEQAYEFYKEGLLESFSSKDRLILSKLMDGEAESLLESVQNLGTGLPVYETLRLPLLTVFWPRLVAKEMVTVDPIDAPEVIRPFLRPYFVDHLGNRLGDAPSYNYPSYGNAVTKADDKAITVGVDYDILADMGLTNDTAGLQRTVKFYKFEDANGNSTVKEVVPFVSGDTSLSVRFSVTINNQPDEVIGYIDLDTGKAYLNSKNGVVAKVYYVAAATMEKNIIQKRVKQEVEKITLRVTDQEISAEWTVQLEQDLKALYDIDFQAKILEIIGKQIALDVDNTIIHNILDAVQNRANPTHIMSFNRVPPSGYSWGPLYWYRNVLDKLARLSSTVYADTNIGEANVMAINPIDSSVFIGLQDFSYDGDNSSAGAIGYQTGTLNSKWKVLISNVVPQGKAILIYKSPQIMESIYFFAPYKPATLIPHPLGNVPSFSVLSRNAHLMYRPNGAAILEIEEVSN